MALLYGSICLSNIPKELCKRVKCQDGVERVFLNISVVEKKQPQVFGERTYTHFVSCQPKKEERKENVNYILGDLETYAPKVAQTPTFEQIANSPSVDESDDLPF